MPHLRRPQEACTGVCLPMCQVHNVPHDGYRHCILSCSVLPSVASTQSSRSTSLETDVLLANVSSLPSSVGLAGDLARKVVLEADMEVSMVALTDITTGVPAETPGGDQQNLDIPSMEKRSDALMYHEQMCYEQNWNLMHLIGLKTCHILMYT